MTSMEPQILFRNAILYDGSAGPPFAGDLAIGDGRILAMSAGEPLAEVHAEQEIDLSGKALAPGFIDAHTHDDRAVLDHPDMAPKISQGVTTVVTGNCGISIAPVSFEDAPPPPMNLLGGQSAYQFESMASYADALRRKRPCVNVVALVGHSALRLAVMDDVSCPATGDEIQRMRGLAARSMDEGASGFSTGLFYKTNEAADEREVAAVGEAISERQGIYTTHMRNEEDQVLDSIEESYRTARAARLPLLISHHKCANVGNWGRTRETLGLIERLRSRHPINFDVYPYAAGSTILREDLVTDKFRIVVTWSLPHPEMRGRDLSDVASDWGLSLLEAARKLNPAGAIYFQMHEDDVRRVMASEHSIIGSDGLPLDAHPHPRLWGTFPRVIGRYARDLGLFSMETAIHKMTGKTARIFGLRDRGFLRTGFAADLVVFDPATIIDRATYEHPERVSEGIEMVFVNGELACLDGSSTSAGSGRLLRGWREPAHA
ncbi:MAG: D-aminoacylase [Rhodobacteraceae bacterium]|nr:D-aminoacylase [Paracoccaceae bacterium]